MITIVFLSFILILLICNYYVHHGKNGRFINRIPGPPGLPILGNLLQSFGSREKLWHLLISLSTQYYPIFKYWQIFFPIVSIRHPDDLETILSSPKHIEKSILYDVYHPWLSTGLLTSGGRTFIVPVEDRSAATLLNIIQQWITPGSIIMSDC